AQDTLPWDAHYASCTKFIRKFTGKPLDGRICLITAISAPSLDSACTHHPSTWKYRTLCQKISG
ncbi:MAG: hypothetical protein ABJA75_03155, partial [Bradyrhizobium sp.]